jgi:hypothetical protein
MLKQSIYPSVPYTYNKIYHSSVTHVHDGTRRKIRTEFDGDFSCKIVSLNNTTHTKNGDRIRPLSFHQKEGKLANKKIACFPWYNMDHIENDAYKYSIIACVFVAAVTFLPSRCLTNDRDTHIDTRTDGRDLWRTPLRWAQVYTYKVS